MLLLAGLIAALYWNSDGDRPPRTAEPLVVYCAEAMRVPMEAIAQDYEAEFGQKVILHGGASETLLVILAVAKTGDLFLPADESYVRLAQQKDLIGDIKSLAAMQAVVIVRPGFDKEIKTWDDFLAVKLGLANDATAIGKITKEHLRGAGLWDAVEKRRPSFLGTVNEVANAVANVGSVDAGIAWDAVAIPLQAKQPGMKIVRLKELDSAKARVRIALVKNTKQRANALRLVAFIRAKDKGAVYLKKFGYSDIEASVE